MDDEVLRSWTVIFALTTLLGVYLLILGVGLAGLLTAMKSREAKAEMLRNRENCS